MTEQTERIQEIRGKLVRLYQEMADLTRPECRDVCSVPLSCCGEMYCEQAREWALEKWGVKLEPTGHETIPFMGPSGCTVAPHLRPLCTLHTCEINSFGYKRGAPAWTRKYFKLRDELGELDYELSKIMEANETELKTGD